MKYSGSFFPNGTVHGSSLILPYSTCSCIHSKQYGINRLIYSDFKHSFTLAITLYECVFLLYSKML